MLVFDIQKVNTFFDIFLHFTIFIKSLQNRRSFRRQIFFLFLRKKSVDIVDNLVYKSLFRHFGFFHMWITFLPKKILFRVFSLVCASFWLSCTILLKKKRSSPLKITAVVYLLGFASFVRILFRYLNTR